MTTQHGTRERANKVILGKIKFEKLYMRSIEKSSMNKKAKKASLKKSKAYIKELKGKLL